MTFEEWETARDDSIKFAQKTIESMVKSKEDSELSKLFGATYNDAVTDEIREYNKNIMMTLIETDLYQIAAALNKIAETMPKAPEASSRRDEVQMMDEKELRELEYEKEMQEQAEYMSRWKLRKEIKKKLKALRKMLKGDIISLPQLNIIDKDLATLADPRTLEALRILEENGKDIPTPQNPKIPSAVQFDPMDIRIFKERCAYDTSAVSAAGVKESEILDIYLHEMAETFGEKLLEEGAIKYITYPSDVIGKNCIEMTIMTVEER